jgi:CheY-like chemotaxis protein
MQTPARPVAVVVDDDALVRMTMVEALRLEGFSISEAGNATEALGLLAEADLLVTDVRMPGMDGVELAMTASQLHPALKILIVSGYMPNHRFGEPGGFAYLSKPFRIAELRQLARELVQPLATAAPMLDPIDRTELDSA